MKTIHIMIFTVLIIGCARKFVIFDVAGVPEKICSAAGGILKGNVCICPEGTIVNANATLCVSPVTITGTALSLTSAVTPNVCYPLGAVLSYDGTQCVCVGNKVANADKTACIDEQVGRIITNNTTWTQADCAAVYGFLDTTIDECLCVGDWVLNADKTACLNKREIIITGNVWTLLECEAVHGFFDDKTTQCFCVDDWVLNADKTACIKQEPVNPEPEPVANCLTQGVCATTYNKSNTCCAGLINRLDDNCNGIAGLGWSCANN